MNFMLNISGVAKNKGEKMFFDVSPVLPKVEFANEEYTFTKEARVYGTISNMGEALIMDAKCNVEYSCLCSRCLSHMKSSLEYDINEEFRKDIKCGDGDEIYSYSGSEIDITEVALSNFAQNVAIKHLCKDDCKGLCSICGADLNISECDCDRNAGSSPFDKLKDYFNSNSH